MPRLASLRDWDERVGRMTVDQLLVELAHWRLRLPHLSHKDARKEVENRIRLLERLYAEKNQPHA